MEEVIRKILAVSADLNAPEGWHKNEKLNVYQKAFGSVYAYVTPLTFGAFMAQLYLRGPVSQNSFCLLEVRSNNSSQKMFDIAEQWLQDYSDGDIERINQDHYAVDNPNGVWRLNVQAKEYWI